MLSAPSFLGSKATRAEFSQWKFSPWRLENKLITLMMSDLIIGQQALKNAPVYPSGPGALSEGMEEMA